MHVTLERRNPNGLGLGAVLVKDLSTHQIEQARDLLCGLTSSQPGIGFKSWGHVYCWEDWRMSVRLEGPPALVACDDCDDTGIRKEDGDFCAGCYQEFRMALVDLWEER